MRKSVWSFVSLLALVPACTAPQPADSGPDYAPASAYARRTPPPTARVTPARPPTTVRRRPPRTLTGTRRPGVWYPRSRRISPRWKTIVIHHSGTISGSARTFDRFHRKERGWDSLGYHFVIGNGSETPDGLVEIGPRWHQQKHGAHCKTPTNYYNDYGIGICLVGDFTKQRPTHRQMHALNRLVAFLSKSCSIPASKVWTHGDINRKTLCPGKHFALGPLKRYLSRAAAASSPDAGSAIARTTRRRRGGSSAERFGASAREQLNRDAAPAEGYNMTPITRRPDVR